MNEGLAPVMNWIKDIIDLLIERFWNAPGSRVRRVGTLNGGNAAGNFGPRKTPLGREMDRVADRQRGMRDSVGQHAPGDSDSRHRRLRPQAQDQGRSRLRPVRSPRRSTPAARAR